MSVNATTIQVSPNKPATGPMSKRWNTIQFTAPDAEDHGHTILEHWDKLVDLIGDSGREFAIDGESLNLAVVIAVAR